MSKPVKNLIVESYRKRFDGLSGAVLIDIRGIESNANNELRGGLAQKQIKVTVVKKSLATKAFEGTDLTQLSELFDGPIALAYTTSEETSVVSIARELVEAAKTVNFAFKGALMDGLVFAPDQVKALSKYPTREEAQAKVVQIFLSPAQNLVGSILGPGRKIASLVKAVEEKLESGEEIKKAG